MIAEILVMWLLVIFYTLRFAKKKILGISTKITFFEEKTLSQQNSLMRNSFPTKRGTMNSGDHGHLKDVLCSKFWVISRTREEHSWNTPGTGKNEA